MKKSAPNRPSRKTDKPQAKKRKIHPGAIPGKQSRKNGQVQSITKTNTGLSQGDLKRTAKEQADEYSVIGHLTHSRKAS